MELDDLKNIVDTSTNNYKPINNNIMELISHRSQSTLSDLAQKIKIGLIPFPLTVLWFSAGFIADPLAFRSFLKWLLLFILFIEFIYSIFTYGLVKRLQNPIGSTKENFLSKINRLKISFQKQFLITLCLYSLLTIALEIAMYYNADANFTAWYKTPVLLRISCYIVFLIIQLILKRHFFKKQFGEFLETLDNLIREFQ